MALIEAKVLFEDLQRNSGLATASLLILGLKTMHGFDLRGQFLTCSNVAPTSSSVVEVDVIDSAGEIKC